MAKEVKELRKYTPGPWKLDDDFIRSSVDNSIVLGCGEYWCLGAAEAALIESAPEMVRELARCTLDIMGVKWEKYVVFSYDLNTHYIPTDQKRKRFINANLKSCCPKQLSVLAKALACSPEDITLETLKRVAEVE